MIRHYTKIAVRNLSRQKVLAAINISGLSIGIACFSIFLLYAVHEFSYDRFHANKDRLFRVVEWWEGGDRQPGGAPSSYTPEGPALKQDFPDVEYAVRIKGHGDMVMVNNKQFRIGVTVADPDFFNMFSFPLIHGNAATALNDPRQVVITKEKAIQLFGTADAVGKQLSLKLDSTYEPFIVSGVAADIPDNSSIQFHILASFAAIANTPDLARSNDNWHMTMGITTYVQLTPESKLHQQPNRLAQFRKKYYANEETAPKKSKGPKKKNLTITSFRLQPIREMHTDTRIEDTPVDPKNIWILIGVAAGVLLIACINFTTLAIGRSAGRAREVGVRKVMGSQRTQVIFQFLSESLVLTLLSAILGFVLAYLLLPFFNQLANLQLKFSLTALPELGWLLVVLVLLVGLLAGSYPALVLSRFKPVEVLKSKIRVGGSNFFTRALVTVQFVLSIGLIVATVIILQQVNFMRGKNIGIDKENVVMIHTNDLDATKLYPLYKQAIQNDRHIQSITASSMGLGANEGQMGGRLDLDGKDAFAIWYPVEKNFLGTMGVQLVAGRGFNMEASAQEVIVNESFLQNEMKMPASEAIGKQLKGFHGDDNTKTIVGISKDFNFEDLTRKVRAQLFYTTPDLEPSVFYIRLQPGDPAAALRTLEATWKKLVPDLAFNYSFVDEKFNNFYKAEERWSSIIGCAGAISIFLACLGLFGLASLAAINRTKEIGIRKVLGATVTDVVGLLSKDFVKLIVVALIIAAPLAWYCMHTWLENYAYRIDIHWLVFALAGVFAILIALITIGFQAARVATGSPVNSLRTE